MVTCLRPPENKREVETLSFVSNEGFEALVSCAILSLLCVNRNLDCLAFLHPKLT